MTIREVFTVSVPATRMVLPRQDGENSAAARRRRALQLQEARKKGVVDVTHYTRFVPGVTLLHVEGQREPIEVWDIPQHGCCEPPDREGRIYPRCNMSALDCSEHEWGERR